MKCKKCEKSIDSGYCEPCMDSISDTSYQSCKIVDRIRYQEARSRIRRAFEYDLTQCMRRTDILKLFQFMTENYKATHYDVNERFPWFNDSRIRKSSK